MTDIEASKVIAVMMGAFPFMTMPQPTIELYEESIRDLDYATANAAVRRLILTAKKPPLIAEIREAAVNVRAGERRSGAEAWADVLAAVSKFGVYNVPVFDDPVVGYAVASVGWRVICNAPETDAAPRAKFVDAYNSAMQRARARTAMAIGAGAGQQNGGGALPGANAAARELPRGGEPKRAPFGEALKNLADPSDPES